ncbi:MAG TPA: hypothetical protein DHN33_11560 [Eubacteriaceae bacterium]|nr:hypothetical protein [Eubacteriaceae bacterium]
MTQHQKYQLNLLKTARGQLDGVIKMIEEDRYCIDISHQITAVVGLLKKTNLDVLQNHLNTCVKDAVSSGDESEKIEELNDVLKKILK